MSRTEYRDFVIEYDPPPIGWRSMDWQWAHVDYDGAPVDSESNNGSDNRCGCSESLEAAKQAIDEWYTEEEADAKAEMEHAIKMTDDPLYRDWWNKRQKELDIAEYGIDE
jgi:hypothetical protein